MPTQRLSAGPDATNDLEAAARTLWVLTSYGHGRHFGALLVLFWTWYVGRPRRRKRFAVFNLLSWCQVGAWSLVLPGPASCVGRCMGKSMYPRSDKIQYLLRGQATYGPKIASNNQTPRQSTCIIVGAVWYTSGHALPADVWTAALSCLFPSSVACEPFSSRLRGLIEGKISPESTVLRLRGSTSRSLNYRVCPSPPEEQRPLALKCCLPHVVATATQCTMTTEDSQGGGNQLLAPRMQTPRSGVSF
jgi:hypothetical protein